MGRDKAVLRSSVVARVGEDVEVGLSGQSFQETDVPAEVGRRALEKRPHSQLPRPPQVRHDDLHDRFGVVAVSARQLGSNPIDQDVLVDEGDAEVINIHGSEHSLDTGHGSSIG